MRIAVIGAGAIGSLVAGYLKLKEKDVCLVGNKPALEAISKEGLNISGVRGNFNIRLKISEKLNAAPDLAILAVKTQDIEKAISENLEFLKSSLILTTQNGVQADTLAAKYLPQENIVSSIVMFGATYLEPGHIVHNFEGSWIIGAEKIAEIAKEIFPVVISHDIRPMKYLKIFVNANNCIAAILGKSMQEAFSNPEVSRLSIEIWREGLEIINKAGVKLISLPDFPLERLVKLTTMPPEEAAKIFSGIMMNLSKEPLYGSILQSIKRGRTSEIDYINGEFVRLAKTNNLSAPLNEKLVAMVHQVEKADRFFRQEELLNNTKQFLN